jgi:hypothetical protein
MTDQKNNLNDEEPTFGKSKPKKRSSGRKTYQVEKNSTDKSWEKNYNNISLWINGIGLIVSVIVAGIAIWVYFETIEQTRLARESSKAAVEATKIAQNALDETKRYNDSTLRSQKESNESSSAENKKRFKLDSTSVESQLASLKETQRRFDAEHENFLEVKDFRVDFSNVAKNPIINFMLSNFGGTILVKETRFGYQGGPIQDSVYLRTNAIEKMKSSKFQYNPIYISPQSPRTQITEFDVLKLQKFKTVINESFIIYFCGEIKYISLITKKPMILTYMLSTNTINETKYHILSMDNKSKN